MLELSDGAPAGRNPRGRGAERGPRVLRASARAARGPPPGSLRDRVVRRGGAGRRREARRHRPFDRRRERAPAGSIDEEPSRRARRRSGGPRPGRGRSPPGSAVLLAMDVRPDHRAFLRTAGSLLSEALTHIGRGGVGADAERPPGPGARRDRARAPRSAGRSAGRPRPRPHRRHGAGERRAVAADPRRARAAGGSGRPVAAVVGRFQLAPQAADRPGRTPSTRRSPRAGWSSPTAIWWCGRRSRSRSGPTRCSWVGRSRTWSATRSRTRRTGRRSRSMWTPTASARASACVTGGRACPPPSGISSSTRSHAAAWRTRHGAARAWGSSSPARIVEAHGGSIGLRSVTTGNGVLHRAAAPGRGEAPIRVLIVDDHRLFADAIRATITDMGMVGRSASTPPPRADWPAHASIGRTWCCWTSGSRTDRVSSSARTSWRSCPRRRSSP